MSALCSIQEHVRVIWSRDQDLQKWIPVAEDDSNRLFEEGANLAGTPYPYAVIVDNGVTGSRNLGNHTFFENRTFSVRIYSNNRTQLGALSRRFRLVFSNADGDVTEDGCICKSGVSGGQTTLFGDGIRMATYTLSFSVAENRGPRRLRGTTQNIEGDMNG